MKIDLKALNAYLKNLEKGLTPFSESALSTNCSIHGKSSLRKDQFVVRKRCL
jgi:hypothetical protein